MNKQLRANFSKCLKVQFVYTMITVYVIISVTILLKIELYTRYYLYTDICMDNYNIN